MKNRNPIGGRQTKKKEMYQEGKENHFNYNNYIWQNTVLAWNRLRNRKFNFQNSIKKDGAYKTTLLAFVTHKIEH